MKSKRSSKATRLNTTTMNILPSTIIETILCLLPIHDAVRTCILSKEWRYKWTKIPKLMFNENTFEVPTDNNQLSDMDEMFETPSSQRKEMNKRCRLFYAIYQVLLFHQGPILDFTLSMDADETCFEIDQIIHHLAMKNTVKKFTLKSSDLYTYQYIVPSSLFTLHHLTDLHLQNCLIYYKPTFGEFVSLTSLYLKNVDITTKPLVNLISNSPLLKSFNMVLNEESKFNNIPAFELFKSFHVIEHLSIDIMELMISMDVVPQELSSALIHLKCLCLHNMCICYKNDLPFLVLLIRSSPNLEKLNLHIAIGYYKESDLDSVRMEDYSDISLDHLNELEIEDFTSVKPELEFVKLILVKSPVLKKLRIYLSRRISKDEELKMLRILLRSPRASPLVEIIVEHPRKD